MGGETISRNRRLSHGELHRLSVLNGRRDHTFGPASVPD